VFPRYLDGFAPRDYLAEPLAAEADNVARRRVATIFESDGVTLVAALAPSGQNLMFGSHLDGFANDDNWDKAAIKFLTATFGRNDTGTPPYGDG
jgi:hypothetical protein